jgi:WD40 repeat protein/serine/threonine protein kinase
MSERSPPSLPTGSLDPGLADLVEDFIARAQNGEPIDPEAFLRDHAEHAEALRRLLPTLQALGALASSLSGQRSGSAAKTPLGETPGLGPLGEYEILRELGRGGMGIVYEARQTTLGRRVALKVLPFAAALDERRLQRFKQEAQAAALLHHGNIVPVFGIGCDRGVHFYAMQYIEGQTLAAVIRDLRRTTGRELADRRSSPTGPAGGAATQPAPPSAALSTLADMHGLSPTERPAGTSEYFRQVVRWGIEAAEALEHAHQQGVVHRDVKPANLLVDARGHLWVTDFGLARLHGDAGLTMSGDLLGTLRYMSPEQALGRQGAVDQRTDVHSLGVTLYELLALEPVFTGTDRQELLHRIGFEEPRPIRRWNDAVPHDLETIVLKAMAKVPAERYETAQELADDLRRFMEYRPIRARRPSLRERLWKWARRHRLAVFTALAVAAVVALSVFGGLLVYNRDLEAAARREHEQADQARRERQQAVAHLYHSLVGEARALRLARGTGYRRQAWARLRQALRLDTPEKDLDELRHEAVACMGDFAGLDPTVLKEFPAKITAAAVDPATTWIAVGLEDGRIVVRRLADGGEVARWQGHRAAVTDLVFGAEGGLLISGGHDNKVKIWNARPGAGWTLVRELEMSPGPDPPEYRIRLSLAANGKLLAASNLGSTVRVWKCPVAKLVGEFTVPGWLLSCPALSPDGRLVACGCIRLSVPNRAVHVWDVATHRVKHIIRVGDGIKETAFSANGRLMAYSDGNGVVVLDTATFQVRRESRGYEPRRFGLSPNCQLLAFKTFEGRVRLWWLPSGREVAVLHDPLIPRHRSTEVFNILLPVKFIRNGRQLATANLQSISLWPMEVPEKLVLEGHEGGVTGLAFNPNGRLLASAGKDKVVRIWDVLTGELRRTLRTFHGAVGAVAFSPDGKFLAATDSPLGIQLWNTSSWVSPTFVKDPLPIRSIGFSPDGKLFAASDGAERDGSGNVKIWRVHWDEPPATRPRLTLHALRPSSEITSFCFSPDSRLLAYADNNAKTLHLWDIYQGRLRPALPAKHGGDVLSTAFLPNSEIALFVTPTGVAEAWNVTTRQKEFTLGRPGEFVGSGIIALSPDGTLLAGSYSPSIIALWDVRRRRRIFLFPEELAMTWSFAWSPDGQRLAVGLADGGLAIWDLRRMRSQLAALGLDWQDAPK